MKTWITLTFCITTFASSYGQGLADYKPDQTQLTNQEIDSLLDTRKKQSYKLSKVQDELSADVQELIELQTNEKVLVLLEEVEELMAGVIDNLEDADTGLKTIGDENEIIEKIFEAAKEKSQ